MGKFDQDVFEMKRLYNQGLTLEELAQRYGCSGKAVYNLFCKYNIPRRKQGRQKNLHLVDFVEIRYLKGMAVPLILEELLSEFPELKSRWGHPLCSLHGLILYYGLMREAEILEGIM